MRVRYSRRPWKDDERWDVRWEKENFEEQWLEKLNCEHIDFINHGLILYLQNNNNDNPKIIELAAGAAPYSKYLSQNNYDITMSDFSQVAIKKFNELTGIKSINLDFRNMKSIDNKSFDIVVIIGGIYEFDDFYTPEIAYKEIHRILKDKGVLIHGLGAWQNYLRAITFTQLFQILKKINHPKEMIKSLIKNKLFREIFALKPLRNQKVHFWLYKPNEIRSMLNNAHFNVLKEYSYSIAPGIFADIPLARKKNPINNRYLSADKFPDDYLNSFGKYLCRIGGLFPNLFSLHYGFICQKKYLRG